MGKFIKDLVNYVIFVIKVIFSNNQKNPLNKNKHGENLILLANGPSLKEIIPQLTNPVLFGDADFVVVNYFAEETIFWKLKPQHYCLADPMFFMPSHRHKDVIALYKLLNKVNWNLNLYIPQNRLKQFKLFSSLENSYINIIGINTQEYKGFSQFRNWFYKKGLAIPGLQTVAHLAIYIGINWGYSTIKLYGVDHSFLESLHVNNNNELCNKDKHFYDNGEAKLKPIIKNDSFNEVWKIADYLVSIANMFKGHDILAEYAEYSGTEIINCTKGSYIDSYKRAN